ncbi:rhomboid family intramembrane serine protease [Geitlerinema sp. P-1104]|uniref:rhomboid family intramembrane serine protease n=1 Tax=Geitlerinema sp. P-1104 TaxID=2546230 RepID=UPI001476B7A3|nr:rhomboid family intramembrane serine protease [Geitlerinema sp. P-1104]NMG58899.1 rhomboid family intramembrane serine protease [Geitlerinema sp. P-1104]
MTLDRLVLWIVYFSTLVFVWRSLASRPKQWGWGILCGVIFSLSLGLSFVSLTWAAMVGGGLWLLLVLLPILGVRQMNQWLKYDYYWRAALLARLLTWLHPADGWGDRVIPLNALALAQQGHTAQAVQSLKPHQTPKSRIYRIAIALEFLILRQWQEFITWLQSHQEGQVPLNFALYHLRALGETGQFNLMLREFVALSRRMKDLGDFERLSLARLYVLAFCGDTDSVSQLFQRELRDYPQVKQQFWQATADWYGGRSHLAQNQLQTLAKTRHHLLKQDIQHRLETPPKLTQTQLNSLSVHILEQLNITLREERRYGTPVSAPPAFATWGLIALNLLAFYIATRLGGSQNVWVLYRLGALVPSQALAGEWWRLVTSTFLHFGIPHLSMNLFGLYILGKFLESRIGLFRFLAVYLISGIGSMGFITLLALQGGNEQFVVGASGAVMGLIGAIAALFWQGWRQDKAELARERLRSILLIILIQAVFDLSIPEICFLCHASGGILGFFSGLLLLRKRTS